MALTAYQQFVQDYFKKHPGQKDIKVVAAAWERHKGGGGGGGGGGGRKRSSGGSRRRSDPCASTVVPTADGSAVTTRGGAHLRASVEGHTEVLFDQGALGAIWSGIVERLRSDGGANLAALFPELYPDAAAMLRMDRAHADNRAIGAQMAPLLGAVLVAYRVTPEEWASWYAIAVNQRFVIPRDAGVCVAVTAAMGPSGIPTGLPAEAMNQANQFGGILGAPGGATGNPVRSVVPGATFGAVR